MVGIEWTKHRLDKILILVESNYSEQQVAVIGILISTDCCYTISTEGAHWRLDEFANLFGFFIRCRCLRSHPRWFQSRAEARWKKLGWWTSCASGRRRKSTERGWEEILTASLGSWDKIDKFLLVTASHFLGRGVEERDQFFNSFEATADLYT